MRQVKQYWTTTELAEAADVSSARIRQLLLEDKLQGTKAGPVWIVSHTDAVRFLRERGIDAEAVREAG
jgi:hypothetical protein